MSKIMTFEIPEPVTSATDFTAGASSTFEGVVVDGSVVFF